jgi:hypothetical protein
MSTYREAIQHARNGGTVRLGGKEIRFLTFEEAEPLILELSPSRRTVMDEKTGKALIENGKIVVETYADPNFNTKRLGLYDVGVHPAVQLTASDDDTYLPVELDAEGKEKPRVFRTDWELLSDAKPEVVAPETVDEVLHDDGPL